MLSIPQFDVIVRMPFFKKNAVDLTELDWGILKINKDKIVVDSGQRSSEFKSTIAVMSRKTLKKEIRKNKVEELYLTMTRKTSDNNAQDAPEWIVRGKRCCRTGPQIHFNVGNHVIEQERQHNREKLGMPSF